MKRLAEKSAACERLLREREDELSQIRPVMKALKVKVEGYETQDRERLLEQLREELASAKEELASAEQANQTSATTIEDLEKRVKGKQWMVKSLQEDSVVQRSRENHLLAHIATLNERIDTYEKKFKGKGVDVPLLIAKLKDYEARVKHLQGKVRMLTNRKLNEIVTQAGDPLVDKDNDKDEVRQDAAESMSKASSGSFSVGHSDEEEDGTFASLASLSHHEPQAAQGKGFFGDIITDFKVGIESLKVDLCCAQSRNHPMASPLSEVTASPLGDMPPNSRFDQHGLQHSPSSHSLSLTLTPGGPSNNLTRSGTLETERDEPSFLCGAPTHPNMLPTI